MIFALLFILSGLHVGCYEAIVDGQKEQLVDIQYPEINVALRPFDAADFSYKLLTHIGKEVTDTLQCAYYKPRSQEMTWEARIVKVTLDSAQTLDVVGEVLDCLNGPHMMPTGAVRRPEWRPIVGTWTPNKTKEVDSSPVWVDFDDGISLLVYPQVAFIFNSSGRKLPASQFMEIVRENMRWR